MAPMLPLPSPDATAYPAAGSALSRWDALRRRLAGLLIRFLAGLVVAAAFVAAAFEWDLHDRGRWDWVPTALFAAGAAVALTSLGFAVGVLYRHRSLWRPPCDADALDLPAQVGRFQRAQAERRARTWRTINRLRWVWLAMHSLALLPWFGDRGESAIFAIGLWWCLSLPVAASVAAVALWQRADLPWKWMLAGLAPWTVHLIEVTTAAACYLLL